jgi:hypothetical protein
MDKRRNMHHMAGFLFSLTCGQLYLLVSYTFLARIARTDCHETASSAPPDQGMTMLLNRQPRGEQTQFRYQPQDTGEQVSGGGIGAQRILLRGFSAYADMDR